MAHGTPDLSDLMAVFEEQQQVATTLHQISSGQNVDVRQGVANLPFTQPGLPFSTDMDPQAQLSQIPELDHGMYELHGTRRFHRKLLVLIGN